MTVSETPQCQQVQHTALPASERRAEIKVQNMMIYIPMIIVSNIKFQEVFKYLLLSPDPQSA